MGIDSAKSAPNGIPFNDYIREGSDSAEDYAKRAFEWCQSASMPVSDGVDLLRNALNHHPDFLNKVAREFADLAGIDPPTGVFVPPPPKIPRLVKGARPWSPKVVPRIGVDGTITESRGRFSSAVPDAVSHNVPRIGHDSKASSQGFLDSPERILPAGAKNQAKFLLGEFDSILGSVDKAASMDQLQTLRKRMDRAKASLKIILTSNKVDPRVRIIFKEAPFPRTIDMVEQAFNKAIARLGI